MLPASELPSGLPKEYTTHGTTYSEASPEHVYLSSERDVARAYAARWVGRSPDGSGGTLYSVEVKGPLDPDPDYSLDPGVCWRARIAFVAKVEEVDVPFNPATMTPALRLLWWDDDTVRMYGTDGYALPSEVATVVGITPAHLRSLGECPNPERVIYEVGRLVSQQVVDPHHAEAFLRWTETHAPHRLAVAQQAVREAQGGR